jgi:hypothetical protein
VENKILKLFKSSGAWDGNAFEADQNAPEVGTEKSGLENLSTNELMKL